MAGWRTTGHLPLLGSVLFNWTPWSRAQVRTSRPRIEDAQMLEEMHESAALPTIHGLREAVQKASGLVPEQPKRPELATVETHILDSWRLRRKMAVSQTLIGCGFVFVFRYFRVRLQNLKAHRELQKALRQRRRQRALTMLSQAEEAAEQHDARRLCGIVRRYVQIRLGSGFVSGMLKEI